MGIYEVTLEVLHRNSAAGTTRDVVEADSASEAEAEAIREWKKVAPQQTSFRPLLTVQLG